MSLDAKSSLPDTLSPLRRLPGMDMDAAQSVPNQAYLLGLDRFARVALCHRPTPIEAMTRMSALLGGPALYIKRDDCTGLAGGGNKTRKLEFLVGEALNAKADMLVTQGAVQSNHVRQTAAAACCMGLKCHVLLERRVPGRAESYEKTGNVLLDSLFGATYEFRPAGLDMNAEAEAATESLRAEGHKPYFIPGGGSNVVGAMGYAACAEEVARQSAEMGVRFQWIVMGTGSAGTQAGLVAGLHALGVDLPVLGVSVRHPKARQVDAVHRIAVRVAERLGAVSLPASKILVEDDYVGEGYGIPAESTLEAIRLAARQEGILLDPVYSGKGMAGLIGLARQRMFKPGDNVLFLHTGGAQALFAYEDEIFSSLN